MVARLKLKGIDECDPITATPIFLKDRAHHGLLCYYSIGIGPLMLIFAIFDKDRAPRVHFCSYLMGSLRNPIADPACKGDLTGHPVN